jgi:hypothetical protein
MFWIPRWVAVLAVCFVWSFCASSTTRRRIHIISFVVLPRQRLVSAARVYFHVASFLCIACAVLLFTALLFPLWGTISEAAEFQPLLIPQTDTVSGYVKLGSLTTFPSRSQGLNGGIRREVLLVKKRTSAVLGSRGSRGCASRPSDLIS